MDNYFFKKIFKNSIYLTFFQITNYLLPLIIFPYLIKTVGIEKFGLLNFSIAFVMYFQILIDYGFTLSGTRNISINRNNIRKLNEIYSSIIIIKILISIISIILFLLIICIFDFFHDNFSFYIFTFGIALGQTFFSTWFFQGLEEMKYITFINFFSKTLYLILILVIISETNDFILIPILNSISLLFAAIISNFIILKKFNIKFSLIHPQIIINTLKDGFKIFLSGLAINFYTNSTIFILGLITNNTIVGYYTSVEKIVRGITNLTLPIFNSIYPFLAMKVEESKTIATIYLVKILKCTIIISFFITIIVFLSKEVLIDIMIGENNIVINDIFNILILLVIIIPISQVIFNLGFLSFKLDEYFLKIYTTGAFINFFLLFLFLVIFDMKVIGVSYIIVIIELFLIILGYLILNNKLLRSKVIK